MLANNVSHSWTKYYSIINIPQLCLQLSFEWLKFLSFFVHFIFFVESELVQFLLMFPQTLQFNKQPRDERDPGLREDGWVTNNYYMYMINKQPLFGKKICTNICLHTLSVPRCKQFFESKAQGKLWMGNIAWVYSGISLSFSWGIFGHVLHIDQSHASKNIWWIISWIIHTFWLIPTCDLMENRHIDDAIIIELLLFYHL